MLIQKPLSSPQLTAHSPLSLSCSMQAHLTRKMQQLLFPTAQHNFSFPHWPSTPGLTAHPTLLTYYTSCPWLPFPSAPFSFSLLGTRGSLLTLNPPSACRSSHRTDPLQYISRCYSRTQTFCSLSSATSRNLSAL